MHSHLLLWWGYISAIVMLFSAAEVLIMVLGLDTRIFHYLLWDPGFESSLVRLIAHRIYRSTAAVGLGALFCWMKDDCTVIWWRCIHLLALYPWCSLSCFFLSSQKHGGFLEGRSLKPLLWPCPQAHYYSDAWSICHCICKALIILWLFWTIRWINHHYSETFTTYHYCCICRLTDCNKNSSIYADR